MIEVPTELAELPQWVTWRYENRGGKPTKVPYQVNGELASTTDPTTWSTFEEASKAAAFGNFAGVGFVFTEADDLVGIDLDNCFADGELVEWAQEIVDRFQTYAEISPSGNGVKLFTRGVLQSGRGRRVAIGDGAIELYSWGRYFTVTGDHLAGTPKGVNAAGGALEWLEERLPKKGPVRVPSAPPKPLESYTSGRMLAFDRACRYADKYPPAIAGQGGHDTTFRLACVLANGFDLDPYQVRQILDRYNCRCEPPWSDRELEHKIDSAVAVGDREGNRGYMLAQDPVADSWLPVTKSEEASYEVYLGDLLEAGERKAARPFPKDLLHVPGFVNDVADWIDSQNGRKNRIISIFGGIMLQAALAGRKVRDKAGNRTNLYTVLLAPSGGGKQAPQSCIKKILCASDQAGLYGGKVASDSAMSTDLVNDPSKLWLWDEFGRFLRKTREKTGGAHLHAVQESLLELWGAARDHYKPKSLADSKLNRVIQSPCASFFGLSVPGQFWNSLEETHIEDGFAARLLVIDSGPKGPYNRDFEETDPPDSIVAVAKYWKEVNYGGNLSTLNPVPRVIPETPEASEIFNALIDVIEEHDDETEAPTWSRAIEKARRLAMVYALSKDHEAPLIDAAAAEWGAKLTTYATEYFLAMMKEEVGGDDAFSMRYKQVLKIIRQFDELNHLCSRTHLARKLRIKTRELNEIIESLVEAGRVYIVRHEQKGPGRPAAYYTTKPGK